MFIKYNMGKDFFDDNKEILLSDEIKYGLAIHNSKLLDDYKTDASNFAIKVINGNDVLLTIKSGTYPMVLAGSSICVGELIKIIDKYQLIFDGIIGSTEITDAFINEYLKNHKCRFKLRAAMSQMVFKGEGILNEHVKVCSREDTETITDFLINFYQDCFKEDITYQYALKKTSQFIGNILGYYDKGVLTAVVKTDRETDNFISIGFAYTKPIYRCQGYMQRLMLHACKLIQDKGKTPILHVDTANPISNHVYQKVGFKVYTDDINYDVLR